MIRFFMAFGLLSAPWAVEAQQPQQTERQAPQSPQQLWLQSDTQILSTTARLAFPRTAGPLSLVGSREYSNPGQGMDNSLAYRSPDGAVIGTVYVYYPGLPHSGLAAFATDLGIRSTSPNPVRSDGPVVTAAGGVADAGIRIDYENYRGMDSSAAFIKAGRWIIKVRVSAPAGRRGEVDAAMTALLRGIEFGRASPPFPATPLTVADCPAGASQRAATLLPDPAGAELAAYGLLATFDGGGNLATNENGARQDLPSRVPRELCLSSTLSLGNNRIPVLRGPPGEPLSVDGRTRLIAVISDSGTMLEVVHATNLGRYVMLFHQIGATAVLGSYDDVPSDQQIAEILSNPQSDAARIRVPVTFRPNQGPQMHLPALPPRTGSGT